MLAAAAAGAFALTMGARQTMGLFLSSLNSATHLPGVIAACGLPVQFGAWSLAMGWAVGRWRMKSLLSLVYAARAVAVLAFMLAPKTGTVMLIFAAVMGLTFLSTVPPPPVWRPSSLAWAVWPRCSDW